MASTVGVHPDGPSIHATGRGRWIGLALLSIGVAMIIVDATIVNVAVPSIIRELALDSTQAEWINTIYALVFAALLITLGRLGDVFGRRRMYLGGLGLFLAASVLAGASPSGDILILARVLQGVGGAMILPATQAILNSNFQGRDRAIAFGIWGSVIGGVAAVGPLLGGFLTTYASWRWAFFVNVPVGLIAIAGTLRYIGESRDEHARPGFDLPGFLLITGGLGAFVFGLIEGRQYGWWTPNPRHPFEVLGLGWPLDTVSITPFAIGFGIVALLLFAAVESRRRASGSFYLFDFTLWRYKGFRYGNLAGTIVSLGEFGLLFALPLFLQGVLGYSAFDTGAVFLSLAMGAFFAAPGAATLARRYGPRWVVTTGMLLEAVGIAATTFLISTSVNGLMLAIPLFVYGVGVGFATAQLRQVGSALGIAILGTILFSTLVTRSTDNIAASLPDVKPACQELVVYLVDASAGQVLPALKDPSRAAEAGFGGGIGALPPEQAACFTDPAFLASLTATVTPIEQAFVDATRFAGFTATGFVLLGVVFSLLLPAGRHRPSEASEASGREEIVPGSG